MQAAIRTFNQGIARCNEGIAIYRHLRDHVAAPVDFSDLLRAQIVNSISCWDYLIHRVVLLGMIEQHVGKRPHTKSSIEFSLPFSVLRSAMDSTESGVVAIESGLARVHNRLSYQNSENVAKALALISFEKNKWQIIAKEMGSDKDAIAERLDLIVAQRNRIVHEADIDPVTGDRFKIDCGQTADVVRFIAELGQATFKLFSPPPPTP